MTLRKIGQNKISAVELQVTTHFRFPRKGTELETLRDRANANLNFKQELNRWYLTLWVSKTAEQNSSHLLRCSTGRMSNIILHRISGSPTYPFMIIIVLHLYRLCILLLVAIFEAERIVVRNR
jgi:hypothetical protein